MASAVATRPMPGFRLALFSAAFAVVVVLLGAWTRLADAGLGCPDWPGCYGFLSVPETAAEIAVAEARFPDAPVEVEKGWPEMIHRYFAGSLGLLILGLAAIGLRNRKTAGYPWKTSILLLGLVILQAAFGMWTVTLKLWPQVVTTHLLGGFATLVLLVLQSVRMGSAPIVLNAAEAARRSKLLALASIGMLLVIGQIALGGWVSSNYAALACPDLPTCQNQWFPPTDFAQGFNLTQEIGPNYLGGMMDNPSRVAIHLSHRIGAIVVTVYLLSLVALIIKSSYNSRLKNLARTLLVVLIAQVSLGLSNIIWLLPLPVAVAHNGGGACLLLVMVVLVHTLATARITENNSDSPG